MSDIETDLNLIQREGQQAVHIACVHARKNIRDSARTLEAYPVTMTSRFDLDSGLKATITIAISKSPEEKHAPDPT